MARAVSEIEREIRELKPDEQERLLRALVEELDGPPDPGVEQAWLEEAQRRIRELDSGAVAAIPAEDDLAKERTRLKPRGRSNFTPAEAPNAAHHQLAQ